MCVCVLGRNCRDWIENTARFLAPTSSPVSLRVFELSLRSSGDYPLETRCYSALLLPGFVTARPHRRSGNSAIPASRERSSCRRSTFRFISPDFNDLSGTQCRPGISTWFPIRTERLNEISCNARLSGG